MSAVTTGETSDHEPGTDWRRLHEMEADDAFAQDPDISALEEASLAKARLVGKPSKASLSAARFQRTVTRVTIEACWLHRYQKAITQLHSVEAVDTDFFRVAFNGLLDGRLIRLIRILEKDRRCASFWYLHRADPHLLHTAANQVSLDLELLDDISTKLRPIRNRAFAHIDKHEIFSSQKLYKDAAIKIQDVELICLKLQEIMKQIYFMTFNRDFEADEYDGSDIAILAQLRDDAEDKSLGEQGARG